MTYNVAGLPEGLSATHPERTLPQIGSLLGGYDLALIQEDFAYPALLRQKLELPFRSPGFVRGRALHFGDGLSQFSKLPLGPTRRQPWRECHGILDAYSDCLTPKGLARTRVELAAGVFLDVYNVHLDAGAGSEDRAARASQLRQLFETIESWSADAALLIAGDFNLGGSEGAVFRDLQRALRAEDACASLRCPEPWRIDRILLRSSTSLRLAARSWRLDRAFRDALGRPLSDHLAVAVEVAWSSATSSRPPPDRA